MNEESFRCPRQTLSTGRDGDNLKRGRQRKKRDLHLLLEKKKGRQYLQSKMKKLIIRNHPFPK